MNAACPVCKNGVLKKGTTTVTIERNNALIIFKEVPAMVCNNCAAYFLDEKMSIDLYKRADDAIRRGIQLEIIKLTA